ncbi:MAG: alpha/beta fold hydrolase [Chloroflexi bacterium]|nr:alpha/beta fold hydrolase [Chloroflexota bacterium]
MPTTHTEEIVYTETGDGFVLEGVALRPLSAPKPLAVIWVHGLTGRFYARTQMLVSRRLVADGYTVVSGNNRGHDFGARISRTSGEPVLAGGGWELFDESPQDVDAWVTFAAGLGFERIVVIGHSLGALKAAHYQATRQDARVAGLVAASPPIQATRVDPRLVALARQMVAEGRGRDLLPWGSSRAGAGTHSATTFLNRVQTGLDQYGLDTADPAIGQIRCPILALFGTVQDTGDEQDLAMIRRNAQAAASIDTVMIDGADHVYTGREAAVGQVIVEWLAKIA